MTSCYAPRRVPESRELQVRGLRHHVTCWRGTDDSGPVILLHGFMDTGETFQFLVDAMSDRWNFAAPDWRGFGRTEWPADGYWFPDYYGDLDALLDDLSPDGSVTLIGHSMGGNIAMTYAGLRPERVRRVVCIEGFGLPRTRVEQAPQRMRDWLRQLRETLVPTIFPSVDALATYLANRNPRLPPERAQFIARSWSEVMPDGAARLRFDPAHKRINPVLYRREESEACWREVTAPVLYVLARDSQYLVRLGGEGDPEHMQTIVRTLQPCWIEDASHMLHLERPELLASQIESFLART